jgi:hypothetical protein
LDFRNDESQDLFEFFSFIFSFFSFFGGARFYFFKQTKTFLQFLRVALQQQELSSFVTFQLPTLLRAARHHPLQAVGGRAPACCAGTTGGKRL